MTNMHKGRMEAFSDGVIAILITIMVLEFKVPHGTALADLKPVVPVFLSYILSFIYLGIYWNNHHHLLQAAHSVSGRVLWANLHLLFWLSLVPFTTGWIAEDCFQSVPVALYGVVLLMAGFAYFLLSRALIREHGNASTLAKAIGGDTKAKASVFLYAAAILLAAWNTWTALILYVLVAVIWLIPDRRIEKVLR
jgi:uncharacterized membrane protein